MDKYKLLKDDCITIGDVSLYRIQALKDFGNVGEGELGGYIQSDYNLSQNGNAWVFDNAKVYDKARIWGNALVCGDVKVYGNALVCGDAVVRCSQDYIVFKNWWSSGRFFTWTRSNNMWKVGCFYGTGKELIEKAYKKSEISGREYERVVKYVESIDNEELER